MKNYKNNHFRNFLLFGINKPMNPSPNNQHQVQDFMLILIMTPDRTEPALTWHTVWKSKLCRSFEAHQQKQRTGGKMENRKETTAQTEEGTRSDVSGQVPGLGGAFFALNCSADGLVSFSKIMLIRRAGFSFVYLLLSKGCHLGAWRTHRRLSEKPKLSKNQVG